MPRAPGALPSRGAPSSNKLFAARWQGVIAALLGGTIDVTQLSRKPSRPTHSRTASVDVLGHFSSQLTFSEAGPLACGAAEQLVREVSSIPSGRI